MMTQHDIKLTIDGEHFEVTVSKMTPEQLETHNQKFKDLGIMCVEHDDRFEQMKRLNDKYELNKQLSKASEALKALNELELLEATPPKSYVHSSDVFKMIEEANQSRFLFTVSGNDKTRLRTTIETKRISFRKIIALIDKKIEEAEEGK